jgi:hypothetical protein
MSIDSTAAQGYSDPNSFVPVFASERADTARTAAAERAKTASGHKELSMFAEEEPSFWDLLDVINPLQHIPVVNDIYRELTGDQIGVGARLAGGTLFGGPIGLIASAVNCLIEEETGDTLGGHALALFKGDESQPTAIASADPANDETAQTAAAVQLAQAQVVDLPQAGAGQAPQAQTAPMMFGPDGPVQTAAAPAMPLTPQASQTNAPTQQMAALGAQPARFFTVPARNTSLTPHATPPLSVPVSNSGNRSNVPITGRDPVANSMGPTALAVQKVASQQGIAGTDHPMVPGGGNGSVDWVQAMGKALDKYERTHSMATRPQPAMTVDLQ